MLYYENGSAQVSFLSSPVTFERTSFIETGASFQTVRSRMLLENSFKHRKDVTENFLLILTILVVYF